MPFGKTFIHFRSFHFLSKTVQFTVHFVKKGTLLCIFAAIPPGLFSAVFSVKIFLSTLMFSCYNERNPFSHPTTSARKESDNMKKDYSHPEAFSTFLNSEFIQIANIQYRAGAYYFGKHMHSNLEIYRLLEGSCQMEIGSTSISCVKDDFVIIMPNIVHSLFLSEGTDCTFEHIHFSPELPSELALDDLLGIQTSLLNALIYCYPSFCHIPADYFIKDRVSDIVREMEQAGMFSRPQMNLLMSELLIHLLQLSDKDFSSYTQKYSVQNMYVLSALQYIEQNYADKIEVGDIADQLHISSRYLNKLFQKHTNMTLLNYINVFRMNQAFLLMTDPQLTLTEIASRVGMNDSQHFSKLFKSVIGSSPSLFRKTLSNEEQRQEWIPLGYQEPRKD